MVHELIYPTVVKSPGPWLIGAKDLLALDEVFEEIIGSADASENSRSLKVFLSKDRELKTSSFKEAMSHVGSQDETALGFRYELKMKGGYTSVQLAPLSKRKEGKDEIGPQLIIKVSPQRSPVSQDIMGILKSWLADVQPPSWKTWLFAARSLGRGLAVFVLIFGSLILFSNTPSASDYKEMYKQQARELLKSGINQQNQAKATEIILALQSDFIPPGAKAQHAQKSFVIFFVIVFVLGVISATPAVCLGIWKGKQRLRLWELWFRINFYTIPTLILTSVFWPQLVSTVERALRP
jgi:hypothetical protein